MREFTEFELRKLSTAVEGWKVDIAYNGEEHAKGEKIFYDTLLAAGYGEHSENPPSSTPLSAISYHIGGNEANLKDVAIYFGQSDALKAIDNLALRSNHLVVPISENAMEFAAKGFQRKMAEIDKNELGFTEAERNQQKEYWMRNYTEIAQMIDPANGKKRFFEALEPKAEEKEANAGDAVSPNTAMQFANAKNAPGRTA